MRATIAQKSNDGGDLFRLMMGVLKDDDIDIDGLVCESVSENAGLIAQVVPLLTFFFFLLSFVRRYLMKKCPQRIFFLARYTNLVGLVSFTFH